jgi:hypothetical protein
MLEINCNKCENLGLDTDGFHACKVYGPDCGKATKACRADLFMNYNPKKEQPAKFTPGAEVWVVGRTGGGTACDVSGYVFLAEVAHAVIVTPYIDDLEDLEELLDYHIEETADNYDTDLAVLPAADCYTDKDAAHAALRAERGEEG